jgi:dihydrofolate synthase/folylpolyglutamate synthase
MTAPYAHTLQHLFARSSLGMRLGLTTTQTLLAALGRPDEAFEHVLVGGTNGKGSTSRLLFGALHAAGHPVGLFTSPHLLRYTERIRVGTGQIPPQDVVRLYGLLSRAEDETNLRASFFEATTLLACLWFQERGVPLAVMEVGLGGRLDATNALCAKRRRATLLTPIDLDHQHILGPDRITIAEQKAAIMRAGVPVIIGRQHSDVATFLHAYARQVGAPLTDVTAALPEDGRPTLSGYLEHNRILADGARSALHARGLHCPAEAMDQAVRAFDWPGRYQRLPPRRPDGPSYLIDGSHNPAGMAALLKSVQEDATLRGLRLHALFAVMPHKDEGAMRALLVPKVRQVHRCHLAQLGPQGPDGRPTVAEALDALDAALGPQDVIVVVGSLYLAGEALAHLCGLPTDPPVMG